MTKQIIGGGQQGGMTYELGEFLSVCNKSVQAQSTNIHPALGDGQIGEFLLAALC